MTVIALWPVAARSADQITRYSDPTPLRGEIEDASQTQIVLRRSSDERVTVSTDDLDVVRFDQEPPAVQTARSAQQDGDDAAALQQLQQIAEQYDDSDKRVRTEIAFLAARSHARLARADPQQAIQAVQVLEQFLQQHPDGYRTLPALLLKAELMIRTDKAAAEQLLRRVEAAGVDGFLVQADMVLAEARMADGELQQALAAFDQAIQNGQSAPNARALRDRARIGRAACLRRLEQSDQAIQQLKQVIAESSDDQHELLAQAWLEMGRCHLADRQPRAALLAYLHIDLLYPKAQQAHAQALQKLTELWSSTGHPDRAQDARTRLETLFPDFSPDDPAEL